MTSRKSFFCGYIIGIISIVGCASVFPWRYYAPQMPDACYDQGKLLGKNTGDGWPDLALDQCKPDSQIKLKCMVVLVDDFYAMKSDDEKCHADLQACQKPPQP